jgi:DMSO/TMAO reductase YedYZ heme-binding membrane subunit
MSAQFWWYTARAGGLVAWALATASVVWGLLLSGRITRKPKPAWVLDLHRFLGALTVVFVGVHVLAIWLDSFVHFGPAELFVPLASSWKPGAVAWGVVALYLLIAIEVTSLLQRRIPRRLWRAVHLSSFGLFAFATIHALTAGTDSGSTPVIWFAIFSTLLVVNLTVLRIVAARQPAPARRPAPVTPRADPPPAPAPAGAPTRAAAVLPSPDARIPASPHAETAEQSRARIESLHRRDRRRPDAGSRRGARGSDECDRSRGSNAAGSPGDR